MTTQKKKNKEDLKNKQKSLSKSNKKTNSKDKNEPKIKFKVVKNTTKSKKTTENVVKQVKKVVKSKITKDVKITPKPKKNSSTKKTVKLPVKKVIVQPKIKSKPMVVKKLKVEKTKEKEKIDTSQPVFHDVPSLDENSSKRRRGRNKKDKIYFSKKTEEAIIEYNKESCMNKRNEIYEERIKYSFEKLVENIFNTFKFTYFDNSPIEIQRETVSHLVSNMHKFQEGKGKAFSYFSIVAKNYLIFHNNNNYKRYNQHVDISETPSETSVCLQTEDVHHKEVQNKEFMNLLINYWEKNVNKIFNKSKDLNIAYAVIELFRNCTRIENFNKKTLYLYIRELSNCKTQQITKVINKMKNYQNVIARNYLDEGNLHG